jgi:hypothetical protein
MPDNLTTSKTSAKVVRDEYGLLLVFSDVFVKAVLLEEGDELIPLEVKNGELTLLHEKKSDR